MTCTSTWRLSVTVAALLIAAPGTPFFFLASGTAGGPSTGLARRPDDAVGRLVGDSFSISDETSHDEKCLISLVTTFAEGAVKKKKYGDAANMLANLLLFAHDDDVRAAVHANVATAQNLNGLYKEAEFHGREAALLRSSPRGYANWATAVAYQDDYERATSILSDALVECPNDDLVRRTHEQISEVRASLPNGSSVPLELRGKRAYSPAQQMRGLAEGEGRNFMNHTDIVISHHKQLHSKLNPRDFELGSVFRRVGDLGGHISSTKSMEKI
ncbi:membrane-associated protein, putative [Bodo saltans]|uniref:Membrane-associated protein, putative n=1 Tax=Bodo saltans TaxID=75058 RepID=A0A0S4JA28_BODSA|nr:membrane-associated protein, putative [Bodo saltans]|eukprot:CUG86338.1 membrane-associated protein, putative [Bodo saltans]